MRRLASLSLLFCLVAAHAFAAPTVSSLVKQYGDLRLGETKNVSNLSIPVGHATFRASGPVAEVLAGDQPVGVFIAGGTFTYELANKDEHMAVRYNAKHGDVKLQGGAQPKIEETFKSALIVGARIPAGAAATGSFGSEWEAHHKIFDRNTFVTPPEHLFAYQVLDATPSRVVRAEITGTSRPFVYTYDDAIERMETLHYLRAADDRVSKLGTVLWQHTLSRQAIGRDNRDAAPPRIKLTSVDVNLVGKMDETATLTVIETLVPLGRPANAIHFELDKYIYFDANRDPRRHNLRKVVDADGKELDFSHENGDLVVGLARPAPAGQPLVLRFEIDGNFLYRHEKTNFWELGIHAWFPWTGRSQQAFTFHSVVKVEKPFVAFASGKTIRRVEEGDYNVIETKLDQTVPWVSILAGKYHFDEETRNGVNVRVASFLVKNKEAYKKLRNIAFAAIEYYPTFLGPFPFEEITIIEKGDFFGYGQAPAGIVFISSEAFTPKLGEANEYVQFVNMRFAHEIAHAYWGSAVPAASDEEQWIEEAFSEYSAALFMKASKRAVDYEKSFHHWKADAKAVNETGTIPTANQLRYPGDRVSAALARQGLIYAKGAYLLAGLHRELGDQAFLTFLKSYQKSFRWKTGTTKDVIGLLQFITKKDYGPWFEENFYGSGFPDVKLK